ncbi:MAG: type VI secretion system ATPase TssH, partial [Acidobacteriota bacterium]|nr:type VI secretion system ATPase TssH [Acidobacteriota bacterium]
MSINLKSLIAKLNDPTRSALEGAAGLCLARTHYDVEIEHYLVKLLDGPDIDFAIILKYFGVDKSRLTAEFSRSLDKLKSGNARTPALSPTLVRMFTEAWAIGSIDYGASEIRSGFTILALVTNDELLRLIREVSREFSKIESDTLRKEFSAITAASSEETLASAAAPAAGTAGAQP